MTAVTLTLPEVLLAAEVGIKRQVSALKRELSDCHGADGEDGWTMHIDGACAEAAVAKLKNVFWSGTIGDPCHNGDVGKFEVRMSKRSDAHLILRDRDPPDRAYVLVTGRPPAFNAVGWILARDGKRAEWQRNPAGRPAAYFVPQSALRPMSELEI